MRKPYNTPKRACVIKTRLSQEEKAVFDERLNVLGMSAAEYIRQAILTAKIQPVIRITPTNALNDVGTLIAEYGKIGGNLNQIARRLNEGGMFTKEVTAEVRTAVAELYTLKYRVLEKLGEAVGND
nr:plasmid mobilization relaxosome protein MobC [uncultured Caproiciproducens sp.]